MEASKISGMLGGYGILYSVKADEMFSKRKETQNNTKTAEGEDEGMKLNPKDLPRLFHVKGRRRPFAKQVELTWKSLNSGDCFILDTGKYGKVNNNHYITISISILLCIESISVEWERSQQD